MCARFSEESFPTIPLSRTQSIGVLERGTSPSLLLEHFQRVYAVEPHPGMRAVLAARCPARAGFRLAPSSQLIPPAPVGGWSHQSCLLPCARSQMGGLYDSRCQSAHGGWCSDRDPQRPRFGTVIRCSKHFGAPRYNLYDGLAQSDAAPHGIRLFFYSVCQVPSLRPRLPIRSRSPGSCCVTETPMPSPIPQREEEFQEYVRAHFWDERQQHRRVATRRGVLLRATQCGACEATLEVGAEGCVGL